MIKSYTGQKRLISESAPENIAVTTLRISDITASTQKFFDNNFRGAIITEKNSDIYGYVEASPDGIAYFFKVLLNAVFGDSLVRVSMEKEASAFIIKTKWRHCRDISEEDIAELESTARLSGFTLNFSRNGEFSEATISMPIKITKYLTVYAVSEFKMHTAYIRVFFS